MSRIDIKGNVVRYNFPNGNYPIRTLTDKYNGETMEELEENYNSFLNTLFYQNNEDNQLEISEEESNIELLKKEINNYINNYLINTNLKNKIVFGINKDSEYKDNWYIPNYKTGSVEVIGEINIKPYRAQVTYDFERKMIDLLIMFTENSKKNHYSYELQIIEDKALSEFKKGK